MASVGIVELGDGTLAGGQAMWFSWNNPPYQRTWSTGVYPGCIIDYYGAHSDFVTAEVTNVQYEQKLTGWTGEFKGTPVLHDRLWVRVKNVGPPGQATQFTVFLSWVAP